MAKWIECVPNISEGRRQEVVDRVVGAIRAVPGVVFLGAESDADHNRSVITFAGPPRAVADAAVACVAEAKKHIDLNQHEGQHPRMGATDVVPFVPLTGATMEDCVELARQVAERIGRELEIPTFLYGEAHPEGRSLPKVRKGQFEKLKELIGTDPERDPDFGPKRIHPTAGATGVGARFFLIAYNVNLKTQDVEIAKEIGKAIREKGGGMPGVKAMGFFLDEKKCAQVSMNLVDYRKTSPQQAFAEIERRAGEKGVEAFESEVIGLVPREAVDLSFKQALRATDFDADDVIETKIQKELTAFDAPREFLDALAAKKPVPGGGSAAAMGGAMAAALVAMMTNLTIGKKKYREVRERMEEIRERATELREALFGLAERDAEAFAKVSEAYKREKDDPERAKAIREALLGAAETPAQTAELCAEVAELAAEACARGNRNAITDCGAGASFAQAACRVAADNVLINLMDLEDDAPARKLRERTDRSLERVRYAAEKARGLVEKALQ